MGALNAGVTLQNAGDIPREFFVESGRGPGMGAAFAHGWRTTIGDAIPLPAFASPELDGQSWAGRAGAAALNQMRALSPVRTAALPRAAEDVVRLWAVKHGQWHLADPYGRGPHRIPAGRFLLQHVTATSHFATAPDTAATILMLPHRSLKKVLKDRVVTGSTGAPELRLLLAHAATVRETLSELGDAGLRAAESTLVELTTAVALGRFDDQESALAPALVRAARDLADSRLTEPGLSPATLARDLRVSVRTLQRAFAGTGEPASAYVRRRRLEEARRALLAAPTGVSEVAARFQFSDSSHFIRTFKHHFGTTPRGR
ncbi:helix-turn-helix domain-containing protein [Symbioplanes lichenis]|uniref:helix-turn-helix domain-containing protein n=1 Tax=Symbioplanes lichenis TaxID=1629072 RepID=UPI00273A3927|nr:helix-turn-helix domain-containing protein [Actinoplanes lichenis]